MLPLSAFRSVPVRVSKHRCGVNDIFPEHKFLKKNPSSLIVGTLYKFNILPAEILWFIKPGDPSDHDNN